MDSVSDKKIVKSNNNEEAGDMRNGYQELSKTPATKLTHSPLFSYSQQEDADNIEVVWDWYSPKSKPRISKQRVKIQQSPKLLVKRHPSNDQISVFNKLEEELKTLTDKTKPKENKLLTKAQDFQDFFNDSMEEELVICSQQVEESVEKASKNQNRVKLKPDISDDNQIENDSFDCILASFNDDDFKTGLNTVEVARKDESPIKCSPEEIEQKRLQALAKLEAKKKQKIIEQNRQQALKRLELSRKRRILH